MALLSAIISQQDSQFMHPMGSERMPEHLFPYAGSAPSHPQSSSAPSSPAPSTALFDMFNISNASAAKPVLDMPAQPTMVQQNNDEADVPLGDYKVETY